jgi:hypothetical protein
MRPQFRHRVVGGGKLPAFRAFDYEAHSGFVSFVRVCLKLLSQVPVRRSGCKWPCRPASAGRLKKLVTNA